MFFQKFLTSNLTSKARKKILIYPKFQLSLILLNLVAWIFTVICVGIKMESTYDYMNQEGLKAGLSSMHGYFQIIEVQESMFYKSLILSSLLSVLVTTVVTLILSHKLAGPIVRLKSYFQEIAYQGTVNKLEFRKGDFFSDLPPIINQALEEIQQGRSTHEMDQNHTDEGKLEAH